MAAANQGYEGAENGARSEVRNGAWFTPREWEVLRLLREGMVAKGIAAALALSPETVRWYLKEIYSKLDAHSMVEALAKARRLGLFEEETIPPKWG